MDMARVSIVEDLESGKQEGNAQENFLYMAKHLKDLLGKDVFLLDGAATTHMVDTWVMLNNERETVMNVKGLGNMTATAKGELVVQGLQLGTALRVPGLGINLMSEGELQTQGCEIISKGNWRKIYFQEVLIIEAILENGLFI